jgi:hypothetical protein
VLSELGFVIVVFEVPQVFLVPGLKWSSSLSDVPYCTWGILVGRFLTCHIYLWFRFFRHESLDCVVRGEGNFDVGFFENVGDEQGFTAGVCEFGPSVVFIILFWFFLLVLDPV